MLLHIMRCSRSYIGGGVSLNNICSARIGGILGSFIFISFSHFVCSLEEIAPPHVMQPNLLCVFSDQKHSSALYCEGNRQRSWRGVLNKRICEKCRCQNEIEFSKSYLCTVTTSLSATLTLWYVLALRAVFVVFSSSPVITAVIMTVCAWVLRIIFLECNCWHD